MPVSPEGVTFVVGSDSLIGTALISELRNSGQRVTGTTRRQEKVDVSKLYLDLSNNMAEWASPSPVSVAVLCAGETTMEMCERMPAFTARINVDSISVLAKNLVDQGAFVVYLSSNHVFDGTRSYRQADEPTSPVTEYGRQKAEAEDRIRKLGNRVAIVRLTKVLYPGFPLLHQWRNSLEQGKSIQPFSDMYMAPVPLDFVVTILRLISKRQLAGVIHVSGDRDISYKEVAFMGARILGADENLVNPVKSRDFIKNVEPAPRHTTLNTDYIKSTLDMKPPDIQETIEIAFERKRIQRTPVHS